MGQSGIIVDEFDHSSKILGDNMFRGAPVIISSAHHEIHCGDSYVSTFIKDVANGGTLDVLVIVPDESPPYPSQDQKLYHVEATVASETEAEFQLYEGPTVSANGTAMNKINRNRNSPLTSDLGIFHTPTITGVGNELESYHWGNGGGQGAGGAARTDEFVLKNNTLYLYRITNFDTSNNHCTLILNHYIHPGE